jgi:uncharacterized protein (DUF58 family)
MVDPREEQLPDMGLVLMEDLESGEIFEVDTARPAARKAYAAMVAREKAAREQSFRRLKLDCVEIRTDRPYVKPISDLFRLRQSRARHA